MKMYFCKSNYHIDRERFQIDTLSAPWVMVSDMACKIFGEHLTHTPIRAFGVNKSAHFQLPSEKARIKLGRLLAPIKPWGEFGARMAPDNPGLIGGLRSLTMRDVGAIDGADVLTNVTIEPSARLPGKGGVYMMVNAHHGMTGLREGHGADRAIETLSARFDGLIEEADAIIDNIMATGAKL